LLAGYPPLCSHCTRNPNLQINLRTLDAARILTPKKSRADCSFQCPDGRLLALPEALASKTRDALNFLFCGIPMPANSGKDRLLNDPATSTDGRFLKGGRA